jgi:hypothetical protein
MSRKEIKERFMETTEQAGADLLTLKEVAEMLRKTPKTLQNWKSDGTLKKLGLPWVQMRVGGEVLFHRADVLKLIEVSTVRAPGRPRKAAGVQ